MERSEGASGHPVAPRACGLRVVIGYGNELRRDDGAGPWVARAVAARELPGVVALDAHQLLPEMAEVLADARLAVFVDATVAQDATGVAVEPVEPRLDQGSVSHFGGPGALLAMTRHIYRRCPRAWLVTVPAHDVALGESMTPATRALCEAAVRMVVQLVTDP